MQKNITIIITPTSSQPRFHKRIESLKQFSNVIVFYFKRSIRGKFFQ